MPATHSNKTEDRQNKTEKVTSNTLLEGSTIGSLNGNLTVIKIEYKRSIHQRCSLCKDGLWFITLWENCQVSSKTMFLSARLQRIRSSPPTVHNIVKRFRESGEISVSKGQGWKPLLNARDHRALRYCLRNCHAIMMDIATWTLENQYHSTQSTTASRNATWNCIRQRGRQLLILHINAVEYSEQTSPHFSLTSDPMC